MSAADGEGDGPTFGGDRVITRLEVPLDERNERALPVAARLAELWGLPIRLLHLPPATDSGEPAFELQAETSRASGRWPGLTIEAEELQGDDVADAVAGALGPGSLLVVATDNANAWSFKNSVAERLVDRVDGPVVLVGPWAGSAVTGGEIVVAFDGRPAAEAALDAAVALAEALGRDLWLVQVVAEPGAGDPGAEPDLSSELDRRVAGIAGPVSARWEVVHSNDPVHAIERFADRRGASFVVAAARGRADATRTTMSSITMGLVAAAGRPVLVVHH